MNQSLILTHDLELKFEEIMGVAKGQIQLKLSDETYDLLAKRRAQICNFIEESQAPAYGFNRGFGHNVQQSVSPKDLAILQRNLIVSHACGVGEASPIEMVRIAMLLRACSLAKGFSGVRPEVVLQLISFLNHQITPLVPKYGSVSASGDLAPLSHIALALIGEGEVFYQSQRMQSAQVLNQLQLQPLVLEMKEGLALNNGMQFTNAIALSCVDELENLIQTATIATALGMQVLLGSDSPYRPDLQSLRLHEGAHQIASWLIALTKNSPLREAHRPYDIDGEVQDPYNLRCAPQILGACIDLIKRAKITLLKEANSVTDNPLILEAKAENGWDQIADGKYIGQFVDIVSGGHFHGMPIAFASYNLLQSMGTMSALSNMRCARYVDENRNKGLGSDLRWSEVVDDPSEQAKTPISSGMMIPEYVSASLTNWLWGMSMPSHLFSISTDAGQEDHVSMALNVIWRVFDGIPRLCEVLAIECAFAAQAAIIRKHMPYLPSKHLKADGSSERLKYPITPEQRKLSAISEEILDLIYQSFPPVYEDRYLSLEISALAREIRQKKLSRLGFKTGI